jgi:Clp amino terminal domain, pathogenicity island component
MIKQSKTPENYHPWTTYIYAREEARRRGDRKIGTEHLVLGLLREPELAQALGCDLDAARCALATLDRDALAAVGIDTELDAPPVPTRGSADRPRRPTLKAVLGDRVPLTPAAKTALRDSSKGMRRGHHIPPQQVLLALLDLEPPDPAGEMLAALGVDRAAVRSRLIASPAAA